MSQLEILALGAVVYMVKSSGPRTEPCGTPYESVTLSDRVSLIFTVWCIFFYLYPNPLSTIIDVFRFPF